MKLKLSVLFFTSLFLFLSFFILSTPVVKAVSPPIGTCNGEPMMEYVAPHCGDNCPTINATAKGDNYSYECMIPNRIEWTDDTTYLQHSSDVHFLYKTEGDYLKFLQDTIWSGFSCSEGGEAMYRAFTGDPSAGCDTGLANWGQVNIKTTSMSCGEVIEKPASYICTYVKPDQAAIAADYDMPLQQCGVPGQSLVPVGGSTQLIYQGPAKCCPAANGNIDESSLQVAVITITSGPGEGETYVYCKGIGLCTHYQKLDWSDPDNDPNSWTSNTDVCALKVAQADNKAEYYMTPVKGILKGDQGDKDEFYADLLAQGYEVRCSVPKINIKSYVGGLEEALRPYLSTLTVNSEQVYDFKELHVPLLRDKSGSDHLFNSIETFFGYRDDKETDPIAQKIASAPLYSLLTLYEQCVAQKEMLENIERMCSKLQDPSTCALDQKIPLAKKLSSGYRPSENPLPKEGLAPQQIKYSYTTLGLLQAFRSSGTNCERLAFKRDQLSHQESEISASLSNVPLYLDKAYRLGFLVVAANLKDDPTQDLDGWNFLRFIKGLGNDKDGGNALPPQEVRIVSFKIPDITTNRDYNSDIYYEDAVQITRNAYTTEEKINKIRQEGAAKKLIDPLPSTQAMINCADSEYCQNPIVKGLVDFVNNRLENPGDCELGPKELPYEEGGESDSSIWDDGGVNSNPGTEHNLGDQSGDVIKSLEKNGVSQTYPPGENTTASDSGNNGEINPLGFNFLSQFGLLKWLDKNPGETETIIKSFLVIPQGYELRTVENQLAGLIYTQQEIADLKAKQNEDQEDYDFIDYFKLSETGQKFANGKATQDTIKIPANPITCPKPEPDGYCTKRIDATVDAYDEEGQADNEETNREPRILGGKLGFLMRKVEQSLHTMGSRAWEYIESSKTTEQYLRGLAGNKDTITPQGEDWTCFEKCGKDFEVGSTAYEACLVECADEDLYCIDWKMEWPETNSGAIIETLRNNLMSKTYTYDQNPSRVELVEDAGPFVDWSGSNIPANKTNYYENYYGGGRAWLWTKSDECGNQDQACFDYIISQCESAGFNPGVCVGMNLTETGGSNHVRFPESADFGCMASGTYPGVDTNLDCLIHKFFEREVVRPLDFNGMWQIYAELGYESSSYRRLKTYYTELVGNTPELGFKNGACTGSGSED